MTTARYANESPLDLAAIRERTASDCSCHRCCVPLDASCEDCEDAAAQPEETDHA